MLPKKPSPFAPYTYSLLDYIVTDADTIRTMLDTGFYGTLTLGCRLDGLDAPEKRTDAGKLVMLVTSLWLSKRPTILVESVSLDKYASRYLGVIRDGGSATIAAASAPSLNQYLLDNKLARPYAGGTRSRWLLKELKPIEAIAKQILQNSATIETPTFSQLLASIDKLGYVKP